MYLWWVLFLRNYFCSPTYMVFLYIDMLNNSMEMLPDTMEFVIGLVKLVFSSGVHQLLSGNYERISDLYENPRFHFILK